MSFNFPITVNVTLAMPFPMSVFPERVKVGFHIQFNSQDEIGTGS